MVVNRLLITVTGTVQGVGFRPFIHNLAVNLGIAGWVSNTGGSVLIDAEGCETDMENFIATIKRQAPILAKIKDVFIQPMDLAGYNTFEIRQSSNAQTSNIFISADIATCSNCKEELNNSNDMRFEYPFINCTNCGPRFSIIKDTPYDRKNTTMSSFEMCQYCKGEYQNIADRRYHAQPIACPKCGPSIWIQDSAGTQVTGTVLENKDVIYAAKKLLAEGMILSVKGIGGYHLVCDATNDQAVRRLRERKRRDFKPFAVMMRDIETIEKYCYISPMERNILESPRSPIVLLKIKSKFNLSNSVAPNLEKLGVMLPYSPVHLLLFEREHQVSLKSIDVLVMTSGNISNEPISYKDDDALNKLNNIADYFLINDREIYTRTDDSVTCVFNNKEYILRRSRGYVPEPITYCYFDNITSSVLACGAELKNTFCISKGSEFYLSHHIGDLQNIETMQSFEEGIEHYKRLFDINPDIVACDMHPQYLSSKYAASSGINYLEQIQHHHAHIASCIADNNINDSVIGVAFDGTGYGEDGRLWGGEFFAGSIKGFKRHGHFDYVKLPGGDKAATEPWRMALSLIYNSYGTNNVFIEDDYGITIGNARLLKDISSSKIKAIIEMMNKNLNCFETSSVGRVFDAVSAILGIRSFSSYEGQAAIELEQKIREKSDDVYNFEIRNESVFKICIKKTIQEIVKDISNGADIGYISSKFHNTIANIVEQGCGLIREITNLNKVALSGGVFQNMELLERSVKLLESKGFEVFTHSRVPANDGGIALGQAVMALAKSRGQFC